MKYLLDTHVLLWTIAGSENLSKKARAIVENEDNELFVSAVSLWEIAVKVRIKKLDLGTVKPEDLLDLIQRLDFTTIELSADEAISYHRLDEASHSDPFDRMLIWQAIHRDLTVISKDADFDKFRPFGLKLVW